MNIDDKKIETIFLIAILVLGIFNIYLASQTAFLGEDEAVYTKLGDKFANFEFEQYTRTGKHTVEPPFIPLVYASIFLFIGKSLAAAKMVTAVFFLLTLLIVYLLGRRINTYVGMFAVATLLLIETFSHMSLLAYVDVPTAFFSALMLYMFTRMKTRRDSILLGLIMGVAYFVKVSTFFVVMLIGLYSLYVYISKKEKEEFKQTLLAFGVTMAVIIPYIIRNLLIYNYPYFILIDIIYPVVLRATGWIGPGAASSTPILTLDYFFSTFGIITIVIGIMGLVYVLVNREKSKKETDLSLLLFLSFLLMFLALYTFGKVIAEQRYLLIVFPQFALVGGYFLGSLKDYRKYALVLLVVVLALSFYTSITMSLATAASVRFPSDYVEALEWVKDNTPKDALVFTTYAGSVSNYANRDSIWTEVSEFDKIMSTDNATYINSVLKEYDISYVVIWGSVVAETYYIPHANLAGVFSYQFVTTTLNSNNSFSVVYQNQNNAVLRVI